MTTIHVSTDGSDRNSGSANDPLASPRTAHDLAEPGDEIVIHDGHYSFDSKLWITKSGEAGNPITMRAADGATPVFEWTNKSGGDRDSGMKFSGASHWVVRGLEIRESTYKGIVTNSDSSDLLWESLDVHSNSDRGVVVNGAPNVTLRNVRSHDNYDRRHNGEGADGFTFTGQSATGLVVEDCVAYNNSDDGFDFWTAAQGARIRNCTAMDNGRGRDGDGNGFKLGGGGGGGGHDVERCVAYGNAKRGFTWNASDNPSRVVNCTAFDNDLNFVFRDHAHTLRNNISFQGSDSVTSVVDDEYNSWNLDIADPEFRSTDPSSDDFLRLSASSPCIDAGVDVGTAYNGRAPDLGAYEYDGESAEERLPVEDTVTIWAADAAINSGSKFQTEHAGFEGDGYVNFEPDSGAYARWQLDVATAGTYDFEIRYANGGDIDRTVALRYGDSEQEITFPRTGAWTEWSTVTGTLELPSGAVDLVIETIGEDGGNVDQVTMWAREDDESGGERAEPFGDTPNHGYNVPDEGTSDWHVPLNENFEAIDRDVPIVDTEDRKDQYTPADRTLYFALDSGRVYVGVDDVWEPLGELN